MTSKFDTLLDALKAEHDRATRTAPHADSATPRHSIDELGAILREQRKNQRMTLQELSDLSDVAYSTLSKLEHGNTAVQLRSLNRVLDALGLKLWIA